MSDLPAQAPSFEPASGLPLRYDDPLVIVGGGKPDLALLHELAATGWPVIAADGGGDVCAAAGIIPDAIIGDMDSLENVTDWEGRTRLIRLDEQQTTDFEKCLYAARAPVMVAVGMTGGRFDHTLAALDACARYAIRNPIILADETDLALAVHGRMSMHLAAGERISVHPLLPITFSASRGLKYPLDGLTLAPGVRTGTSNNAIDGPVEIIPADETPWLMILARAHLLELVRKLMPTGRP